MHKMLGRNHRPHLLLLGLVHDKNESPNENRFLNIDKSPLVLSSTAKVRSPYLKSYGDRIDEGKKTNGVGIFYDSNFEAI